MTAKSGLGAVVIGLMVLSSGCANRSVTELERRVNELEAEVAISREIIQKLKKDLGAEVYLFPQDGGYTVVNGAITPLTVRIVDVQPYAGGVKVALDVGNPVSATLTGVKALVKWGKSPQRILGDSRTTEVSFGKDLGGGKFTRIDIAFADTTPADIGYLKISNLTNSGVKLLP